MVVAPLAIDLGVILACLVALGLILTARYFADALVSILRATIGKVWILGHYVDKGATWIEQHIVGALDDAVNGTEGVIGAFWHALGNLLTSIGHEIYGLGGALINFTDYLYGVVRPWVVHTVIGGLAHGVKWLKHEVAANKKWLALVAKIVTDPAGTAIDSLIHEIIRPLKSILAHLEKWSRARLAAIAHDLEHIFTKELNPTRARAKSLEADSIKLYKWMRSHPWSAITTAFAFAIAVALPRIGLGWLKCSKVGLLGKQICRTPSWLFDDLLTLLTDFAVLVNICQVIPWMEAAFSDVAAPLVEKLAAGGKALQCGGGLKDVPLDVPQLYIVPVSGFTSSSLL